MRPLPRGAMAALLLLLAVPSFALPRATVGGFRAYGAPVAPREFVFSELPPIAGGPYTGPVSEGHPEGVWEQAEEELQRLKKNPLHLGLAELGNRLTLDPTPAGGSGDFQALAPTPGNGFEGITQGPYIPSEPTVAPGPLNVFTAGNVTVTVTNKDGSNRVETNGATFFGVPAAEGAISDAQCTYDALRGRFVALAFTQGTSPSNFSNFYLAISKTNDARGAWWLYKYDMAKDGNVTTGNWSDYESIGITDDKLIMTGQQFTFAGNSYQYPKIRILDRAALYTGTVSAYVDIVNFAPPAGGDGNDNFVTKCARNLSPDAVAHLMCVRTNGGSRVTYREITGSPASPSLSAGNLVTVASYSVPPDAAQQGSASLVATNDCRPGDFYWRNGVLVIAWHTAATISSTNVCAIRLLRLRTSDRAVLTDESYGAASTFYYYPAVVVDSVGAVYLGFDRSSTSEYPSAYATGRRRTDAAIEPSVLLKSGLSATAQSRWGDYTGIDNDASASGPSGTTAWYAGQWTKTTNAFGTWINKLTFAYGQLSGTVADDCDGSAATTGDRAPIAGVTVSVLQGASTIATTTTDGSGAFAFGYLDAGTYDVVVTPPAGGAAVDATPGSGGTSQTRIGAGDVQVVLTTSQTSTGNAFAVSSLHAAPLTTDIVPASKNTGEGAFTLTVNGSNFTSCSIVRLDGVAKTTTFGSANQLTAAIPATDLLSGGTRSITVFTPAPGGGVSNAQALVVNGPADVQPPTVTLDSPAGGESWAVGSSHAITWTATDDIGIASIDLAWSADGGATFPNAIATAIPNSGSFAWTVPMIPTATARVRVIARDGGGNIASDSSHANVTFLGWTVTASAGANGSIAPSGALVVTDGATPSYTITPAAGYHVADVLVNGSSVGAVTNYTFAAVHANQTIAASFAIDLYTLNVTIVGGGTVAKAPDQPTYTAGSSVQLTASPSAGWNFNNWSGDATGTTNPLTLLMNGNKNVTATFGQHVYTWIATGTAPFGTPTNWSPQRTSLSTDDALIFSGGGSVTVTGVTTQTIGRLQVSNGTTVALQSSATATLTIGGVGGSDFDIVSGSTLLLNGTNAITIALATGTTGTIAGGFTASAAAHRLNAVDASALTIASGGVVTAGTSFSGSLFGTGTGTSGLNSVVFQSGALYVHGAGANPFGAAAPSSVVVFQAGSRFRLDVALTPSLAGRTYADFEYNIASALSPTGATGVTFDSLIVTQGTFSLNLTGGATIRGDLHVRPGATLNFTPASGTPSFTFAGSHAQQVDVQGSFSNSSNATTAINNATGVSLASGWTLSGPLAFTAGLVTTGANTLVVAASGSVTGAAQGTGWVAGQLRRTVPAGGSTVTFDVGDATAYTPVVLATTGAAGAFDLTASTSTPDHPSLGTSDLDPVKTVNRWWTLTPAGSPSLTSASATFNFAAADLDAGATAANLLVRRFSGAWSSPTTGAHTATSTQATGLTAFGDFALGEVRRVTLSVGVTGGGSVARLPDQPDYALGASVQLTASPFTGWAFSAWSGDLSGSVNPQSLLMDANKAVTAAFADTAAPAVTVLSPNGGEVLSEGAIAPLTWSATDNAAVTGVDLLLSRTGASGPFETLASGIPNSGSYNWTVTAPVTTDARLEVVAHDGASNSGTDLSDAAFSITTAVGVEDGPVTVFALSPVRPNPTRGGGRTAFALPRAATVHVSVLDVQGREVMVLASGAYPAGRHALAFEDHRGLGAGLYFIRLHVAGGPTFTRRFAITR